MLGLGTIANSAAIILGAILGSIIRKGLPEKWQETMMNSIALCIVIIGIQMALKTSNIMIIILSLVLGGMAGEFLNIEGVMNKFGLFLGSKLVQGEGAAIAIAKGFVNASILFCTGAMAIVGSIQDGLIGDHSTLYAKAVIDGLISLILTVNLGIGVAISAISVGIYQGTITIMANAIESMITKEILSELTAAGGVMILAIGTNMLKITNIRIGNMLPSIIIAVILASILV